MIRGIIFDCFGVLYRGSVAHLYELTPKASYSELANLTLSSDYGYITREEYLAQVSLLTGKTLAEIQDIMRVDHIRNTALLEYIRTLRPRYKVAMLSNVGRGVMNQLFDSSELGELFDTVVLSSEVGMIKPDPDIYRLASERLGVPLEECVMIDDLAVNVDGAKSINMQGIVFNTTKQFLDDIAILVPGV